MKTRIKQRAVARRSLLATTTLLAVLTMVAACDKQPTATSMVAATAIASSGPHDPQAEKSVVTIRNFAFQPATLTVAAGTRVIWTNRDDELHRVVSDDGAFNASPALDTDDSYSTIFAKAGNYGYYCSIHPHMVGRIVVK